MNRKKRRRLVVTLAVFLVVVFGGLGLVIWQGWTPKRGLDLAGGLGVELQPEEEASGESLDVAAEILRQRIDALGVAEPKVTIEGTTVVVQLPGIEDEERALEVIGTTAQLEFRPVRSVQPAGGTAALDGVTDGAVVPEGAVIPEGGLPGQGSPPPGTDTPPESPSGAPGADEPQSAGEPGERVTSQDSGQEGVRLASHVVTQTGPGEGETTTTAPDPIPATPADEQPADEQPADEELVDGVNSCGGVPLAPGQQLTPPDEMTPETDPAFLCDIIDPLLYELGATGVPGENVTDATATVDTFGQWQVVLEFNGDGAEQYRQMTADAACQPVDSPGRRIAIVLDNQVVSAPEVAEDVQCNVGISGGGVITLGGAGGDAEQEARDLSLQLRYGSLPVKFNLDDANVVSVSATLGQDALDTGYLAAIIGFVLIAIVVVVIYRLFGLVLIAGLVIYGVMIWTFLAIMGEVQGLAITLSGLAAIVVAVGLNADSAIVYMERVKDELREGRSHRTAIDRGFKRAWKTIVAGDVVSLLAAVVLYLIAIGTVRGFALMLGVSTLFDLVIAWFFTRPLTQLLGTGRAFRNERLWFWKRPPVEQPAQRTAQAGEPA